MTNVNYWELYLIIIKLLELSKKNNFFLHFTDYNTIYMYIIITVQIINLIQILI